MRGFGLSWGMDVPDRFYCPDPPVGERFTLDRDETRHLARVRRLGVGDVVELFDGRGFASRGEVVELGKDRAVLRRVGEPLPDRLPPCRVTLATAVPKGERFDWLVEKTTELGVERLVPIVTERSVVDPREAKLDRLRRVVVEASKQCGRNALMALERPVAWASFCTLNERATRLLAHPGGVAAADWPRIPSGTSVVVAIGPEGGFTDDEVMLARETGWVIVDLGGTLLRVETAGLAGVARVVAFCGGVAESSPNSGERA